MNSLYLKLALLLAAAFAVFGGLLLIATQATDDRAQLIELASFVMIASVAFALLAALCVFHIFTRRLRRLAQAVESMARDGFNAPLRVPGADANGDEIDRLSTHVERMSERIVEQLAALEQGVERRRELLANVSHDLRTPLTSMQGYLELLLLQRGSLSPTEERNYLEIAVRHSERLGRLVGELFELSKLEAQEAQPRLEVFSLAELGQDIVQKFALNACRRQVRLRCAAGEPDSSLQVHADIGMVERALENLLDNALRHTPDGGAVTVEFERGPDADRVRTIVRDTGPRIPADELAEVFERYDRADRSAPGAPDGLGLAIARRIVNLHGGELAAHSPEGGDTCFVFDLPLYGGRLAA